MKFTHLHVHSHYSLLDGLPKINEILDYIQELGMDSCALTDHGNLYGAVEFYKEAKKRGIKPIIGAEVYLSQERMYQKRANIDNLNYHLVLLVKNNEGYRNLIKLITQANLEGFYYKPRIDEELLVQHSAGLIALSGCLMGKTPYLISIDKIEEARKQALRYQEIFGPGNFYLEIQYHPNLINQIKVNKTLIEFSKELSIPLVATCDAHYLKHEDAEIQDILMLINTNTKTDDPERLTMKTDDFSLRTPREMKELFKETSISLENTQKIVEDCNFEFNLNQIKLPVFETPDNKSPNEYLKELCRRGLENPKKKIKDRSAAEKRLEYELSVIEKTGFASYFLIVQDFVNWAKENRIIVGPGRGSAAGSLVSYLLNITEVNPLEYSLLFERFLSDERISLPDIDLDFADRRRDEVIYYIAEKYGQEKVAQIITFGTMAARAVVRDVGRAMKLSYSLCDKLAKLIPFGFTLEQSLEKIYELRQFYESDLAIKKLIDVSKKIEGRVRHASTHACGVVISEEPLNNLVPLQYPTGQKKTTICTQYEMHSIEDLGLLKIDILGLKFLTIIEDTLSRIYKIHNINVDIENLSFDDKKTYKLLQEGKTVGVFQLESDGFQRYLKELKPTSFEDIIAMVALYRPGPMQFIPEYIARKQKKKKIEYLDPRLKPILEKTQGICIFQEQLMQITRETAGFTFSEADVLRKAVAKKIKTLLKEQEKKFIEGAMENGLKKETTQKIWDWILPFAQYGFNQAHSTAYSMISYQTAYLKAHYPVEFMASLLTSEKNDIEKIAFLIEECKNMKIEVLAPDINESFRNFSVISGKDKIRFGLLAIKNVGANLVEEIIKQREKGVFKSFSDFVSRIDIKDLNKKSLESLIKAGVFDKFEERNKLLENLEDVLRFNRDVKKINNSSQKTLFEKSDHFSPVFKLKETKPASIQQKLLWEKELLGLYISSHPLEEFRKILEKKTLPLMDLKEHLFNQKIRVGGIISSIKKILTKRGEPMLFMKLEDLTAKVEVVVFPSIIERNSLPLEENKIVFITGRVDNYNDSPKIIAENIEEIIEE